MASHWFYDNDDAASSDASSGDHLHDRRNPPPLPVGRYIEQYNGILDGRCFFVMRLAGDVCEIWDVRSGRRQDIAVAHAWVSGGETFVFSL